MLEQSIFPEGFFKVLTGGTFVPVDPFVCPSSEGKFDTFASGDYAKMGLFWFALASMSTSVIILANMAFLNIHHYCL